ncbi:MAG: hypothetical protein ACI4B6_02545, partial [Atopobiaceae bacterium]
KDVLIQQVAHLGTVVFLGLVDGVEAGAHDSSLLMQRKRFLLPSKYSSPAGYCTERINGCILSLSARKRL